MNHQKCWLFGWLRELYDDRAVHPVGKRQLQDQVRYHVLRASRYPVRYPVIYNARTAVLVCYSPFAGNFRSTDRCFVCDARNLLRSAG